VAAVPALGRWLVAPGAPAPDPVAVASAGGRPTWRRSTVTLERGRALPGARRRTPSRSRLAGYLLVLPAVLYVLGLVGVPLVLGVAYSLSSATVSRPGRFVGLRNFVDVAQDPTFALAVRNTLLIGGVATALKITLSVALAFLLLRPFPGRGLVRVLLVLPWTVPLALSAMAWKWMLDSQYSVVNWLLLQAGVIDRPIQWLGTPVPALAVVIGVSTWRAVPFGAVVVLAGLTAIPGEVLEAARVDGAGWWRRFVSVIAPLIAPILLVALLFDLIFTLTELTVVYLLTGGGPRDGTQVLATYALQVGVQGGQLGQGAAVALCLLPALLVLTVVWLRHIAGREAP
jgi:multiple sugar transport system permease protein